MTTEKIKRIERSPAGLADAMFDAIDKLNEGIFSAEEARAMAITGRTITGIARLELDAKKFQEQIGKKAQFDTLPGLGEQKKPA